MTHPFQRTWSFVESIENSADASDIRSSLVNLAESYGLLSVFGGVVPLSVMPLEQIKKQIFFHHQPFEWAGRYSRRGYLFRDPIVHRLHYDRNPFSWSDAYSSCSSSEDVALIKGESSEFDLKEGYVVPIVTLDGVLTAVSFGGPRYDLGPDERSALSLAASYAIGTHARLKETRFRASNKLTAREQDCLLWSAEGKTDWEISVILGISNRTVNKHIASAREKLGAVTKGHAIALALRAKLFR